MHAALDRCYRAVPLTLDQLRPRRRGDVVALKCFLRDCVACRSFDADGRVAFERTLGVRRIIPWSCDHPERRRLAVAAGVGALPAYILVPSHGPPTVRVPT